jgi:hypothetical protein
LKRLRLRLPNLLSRPLRPFWQPLGLIRTRRLLLVAMRVRHLIVSLPHQTLIWRSFLFLDL